MGGMRIPFTKKMLQAAHITYSEPEQTSQEASEGPASPQRAHLDIHASKGSASLQRAHIDIHAHAQEETGGVTQWYAFKGEDELGRAAQGKIQIGFQFRQLAGDLRSIKR